MLDNLRIPQTFIAIFLPPLARVNTVAAGRR
jgi:hypothetical protein